MDNKDLDLEFKKHLQIMRPYLEELIEVKEIDLCNSWIQRLSDCSCEEKVLRNIYAFNLSHQLARGVLYEPFIGKPPVDTLPPYSEVESSEDQALQSDISYPISYTTKNQNSRVLETDTAVIRRLLCGDENCDRRKVSSCHDLKDNEANFGQTIACYHCRPTLVNNSDELKNVVDVQRTQNLISKLRELKNNNRLMSHELRKHKNETAIDRDLDMDDKMNDSISSHHYSEKNTSQKSCKGHTNHECEDRLLTTINYLHEKLEAYETKNTKKICEEVLKQKEQNSMYDKLKVSHDKTIDELKALHLTEILRIKESYSMQIAEKDLALKNKNEVIEAKDKEIKHLREQLEESRNNLQKIMNKLIENSSDTKDRLEDVFRIRAHQLEKKLSKLEKSKTNCQKMLESKISYMQREKDLTDCSLRLQLVRQRAQVANDYADESQAEITTALEKIESKYREIVANIQTTAIQRRIQDQLCLESILQTAFGVKEANISFKTSSSARETHHSQLSPKTVQNLSGDCNKPADTLMSPLPCCNKGDDGAPAANNKSLGEDSVGLGWCLDRERMAELFERLYVPQRDTGDGGHQK